MAVGVGGKGVKWGMLGWIGKVGRLGSRGLEYRSEVMGVALSIVYLLTPVPKGLSVSRVYAMSGKEHAAAKSPARYPLDPCCGLQGKML